MAPLVQEGAEVDEKFSQSALAKDFLRAAQPACIGFAKQFFSSLSLRFRHWERMVVHAQATGNGDFPQQYTIYKHTANVVELILCLNLPFASSRGHAVHH